MANDFAALINDVVKPGLCCSCGACAVGCAQKLITFDPPDRHPGQAKPGDCKQCGACYAACPGRHLPVSELMRPVFNLKLRNRWKMQNCLKRHIRPLSNKGVFPHFSVS